MINSNAEYVAYALGGTAVDVSDNSDGSLMQYTRALVPHQTIKFVSGGQEVLQLVQQAIVTVELFFDGGVLINTTTSIFFGGLFVVSAVFLAIAIDWDPKTPINWLFIAVSDFPTSVLPVIPNDDSAYIFFNATQHVSSDLAKF